MEKRISVKPVRLLQPPLRYSLFFSQLQERYRSSTSPRTYQIRCLADVQLAFFFFLNCALLWIFSESVWFVAAGFDRRRSFGCRPAVWRADGFDPRGHPGPADLRYPVTTDPDCSGGATPFYNVPLLKAEAVKRFAGSGFKVKTSPFVGSAPLWFCKSQLSTVKLALKFLKTHLVQKETRINSCLIIYLFILKVYKPTGSAVNLELKSLLAVFNKSTDILQRVWSKQLFASSVWPSWSVNIVVCSRSWR